MNAHGSPRMVRVVAVLALVIVFSAGVAAGVAGSRLLAARATPAAPPPPEWRPLGVDGRILDGLDLTERQREAIEAILARHRAEALREWQDVASRFREIVTSASMEIRGVLTPEQQQEFDRRLDRRRQAIRWWMGGGPLEAGALDR